MKSSKISIRLCMDLQLLLVYRSLNCVGEKKKERKKVWEEGSVERIRWKEREIVEERILEN